MIQTTSPDRLSALTRHTRAGQLLKRPGKVEAQIRELLPLSQSALEQRIIETDPQSPDFVCEEALVYLIRSGHQRGDRQTVNRLSKVLLKRVARRTNNMLSHLAPDRRGDASDAVVDVLFRRILNLDSDRGDFLQVRFWKAHKGIVLDVDRKQLRELRREVAEWPDEPDEDSIPGYGDDEVFIGGQIRNPGPSIEDLLEERQAVVKAQKALDSVPEPYRTAFVLSEIEGWPIESQDPAMVTVSSHFGKTGRTIRNWRDKARETMDAWRRENP